MLLTHAWRRAVAAAKLAVALATCAACILTTLSPAIAGTTGIITGTVTDAKSGAPIADSVVTAAAPTGTYRGTTNARGFYSITGVYSDTYTVTFQHDGYQPESVSGVNVFADETRRLDQTLSKSFKTIARVSARSTASAYQADQTNNTVTVNASGIQNFQGSAFNQSETNLVSSLPGANIDASGFPIIHGGRDAEVGWQFEGIPYVDAYSNQFTNNLSLPGAGVASIQITAGPGNAANETNGTGSFNLVAKRGTFPSYADCGVSIGGGGGYDHRSNCEFSFASENGRFSNYASYAGSNIAPLTGTGDIPLAQLGQYNAERLEIHREFLDNFIYKWGRDNSKSLQFFADIAQNNLFYGAGGLDGICFASCDPGFTSTWGGLFGLSTSQLQAITALYPYQTNANETLVSSGRAPQAQYQPNQAFKLEYTDSFSNSEYMSLRAYHVNSTAVFDYPSTEGSYQGDSYVLQGGQTSGATLSLTKQFNEKNELQVGADFHYLKPNDSYISDYLAYLGTFIGSSDQQSLPYAFIQPSDPNCPLGNDPSGKSYCGYAYGAPNASGQLTYPQFNQGAEIGQQFYSVYFNDKIRFNDRFNAEVGLRYDAVNNLNLPQQQVDPNYCTTLYLPATWTANPNYNPNNPLGGGNCPFNATFNIPTQATSPKVPEPRIGLNYEMGTNTSLRFTYARGVAFPNISTVAFGDILPSYYLNPYGSLPAYNVNYNISNNLAAGQINAAGAASTNCGISGYTVPCKNFGQQLYWISQNADGIPYQPVKPMTSSNYQFTLSHQFTQPGPLGGIALSIAPWYRKQYDTTAQVAAPLIGANGLPVILQGQLQQLPAVFTNSAQEYGTGIDLNITKENRIGLSGQLTASYTNEFSSVIPTSTSEDFYPNIPIASLQAGNIYRVGFVSPFTATFALTERTEKGWRINPRFQYNVGYPTGLGTETAALINGTAVNVQNTNAVATGSAPNGPTYYVDPLNPGSVFNPNIVASRGYNEGSSPGAKLTPANLTAAITIEYAPPHSALTYGFDMSNIFNEQYQGALFNARYQPIATGISGPLTGYSVDAINYSTYPTAFPYYGSYMNGTGVFVNTPIYPGRSFFFYVTSKL